jgi:hypothetical protein
MTAHAASSNTHSQQAFNADQITNLKLRTDKSTIVLKKITGNQIIVEREIIAATKRSHLAIEVKDNTLEIQSTTPGKGSCEVNYHIGLPQRVAAELRGGHIILKGDAPLKDLSLTAGLITGTLKDPDCTIQASAGDAELEIAYTVVPVSPLNMTFNMGGGTVTFKLPEAATVNHQFTAPPFVALDHFYNEFAKTTTQANFNIIFKTGGGKLNIYKVSEH